ncbi:type I polyketide synthase [Streptomyces marincola]|uniref:Ketosynthase family 3 (KS3) domain-containing protein n=1 Tax=Streptomyces marincola TaxID=2878388 RepID=A0A1W7D0J6_9ACTN|nr:type I polyketide synthase [Streptomyces marincola]ARQ70544.1 hypothetical protein CAG99_18365 [Streptomyces marincola]
MAPLSANYPLVIGVSPFGEPDARLVAAVCRAGGLGVLDLGPGGRRSAEELSRLRSWAAAPYGVRVSAGCALPPEDVGDAPDLTVVLGHGAPWRPADLPAHWRVLAEVTSAAEAEAAVAAGAHGLIARGSEAGGRVGTLSTFVLLQQLLADGPPGRPVWACGGIGPHTAAAALAGGAAGVVLDTQLALLAESSLPERTAAALRRLDGTETVLTEEGHRVLRRPGTADGAERPLPVGQDGYLAAEFARRFGTAARAVAGVGAAVTAAFQDDAPARALAPGSPMSRALGTRLPLAQGPMTRVSDRPGFAADVADAGGLPFLALALATGEQTGELLTATAAVLGSRPWGVGLLGFADEELRAAQLAAVREHRPSHAVIAGGRPAQAAALEAAGIRTFLHVPTPGLLRQFLDAGSRRFVFEGSECGGHVGPLSSFALWEAQAAVLEAFLDGEAAGGRERREGAGDGGPGIEVLFAGGIHDERSAAMVAALAAPLTARGAAVGVLMGTAYLFTEQAVARGAIGPVFQRQVVTAGSTALLTTAPGHATRCVTSPFTGEFDAARHALRAAGVPDRDAWPELEKLNLGRLRIASKGVERVGDDLVGTTEERQLAAGMFMAGDVAVLRSATTTVHDLHHAVGPGAAGHFAARAAELRARLGPARAPAAPPAPLDIAVVGMSCMFPDAADLGTFWANVLGGHDSITEVPGERWDTAVHYRPPGGERGGGDGGMATSPSKWGGFLPRIPFDPLAYGIPPAALGSIEPVQLLALEAARGALADAGYDRRPFDRSRTSVVFGAESGSDLSQATALRAVLPAYLAELPPGLVEQLPALTEDSFPGMLANVIAGRIANRLDLGGANYTVDAACASSLAAVDAACKELAAGTSDVVLCGGADLHNGINDYLMFASVGALSPTGRSRTFDAEADGIALGEGVACVVLKRLADAERDGDRVYAVIEGVGASSDGRARGLIAPRPEGQRAALRRAYRAAGVSPADVGLIEAHGTGTVVGDRTELAVLTEEFTEAGAEPGRCALGSVKSQIGHTKCTAGLAGLIKTVLALHTGTLPPTGNLTRPNPAWDPASSPFVFHTAPRPWPLPAARRRAGVSAFGFGGTNFHAVLRGHEAPPPPHGRAVWPAELFTFRGADHAAAAREAERLLAAAEGGAAPLARLAHENARRSDAAAGPVRVAVVAGSTDELAVLLRKALAGGHDPVAGVHLADVAGEPSGGPGKVAFLFPGQGSQRPGMFAELFLAFPETQGHLALVPGLADVLFPPAAFDQETAERQRAAVTDTRVAQPALGAAGLAAFDLLTRAGVRPDLAAGHSYGELVALCAAGALGPEALLRLSSRRAEALLAAAGDDPGAMAAVPAPAADVEPLLAAAAEESGGRVVVANHNAPGQTVISGDTAAVAAAVGRLRAAGLRPRPLPVACAFHSPLTAGAGAAFADALAEHRVRGPEFPVLANRTAAPYPNDGDGVRAELAAQLGAPVRFVDQVEAMYAAGARVFVEAGPGAVLTGLVRAILGDRPHRAVAVEARPDAGLRGFLTALAELAVAGVEVRTGWLSRGREGAPPPERAPGWTVDGHLVRTADGEPVAGGLRPARRLPPAPANAASGGGERDAVVAQFLATSRELVAAQRDVLLSYFGGAPATGPVPGHAAPLPPEAAAGAWPAAVAERPGAPAVPAVPAGAPAGTGPSAEPFETPAASTASGTSRTSGSSGEASAVGALDTVLAVISERTGYPVDMLDPDLDLEADLSIDSIKRTEIAGELATRLGGPGTAPLTDAEVDELSGARTAAAIAGWLDARSGAAPVPAQRSAPPRAAPTGGGTGAPAAPERDPAARGTGVPARVPADAATERPAGVPAAPREGVGAADGTPAGEAPKRLVPRRVPLGAQPEPQDLAGRRFALLGGGRLADAVAAALAARGAQALPRDAGHLLTAAEGPLDGVLLLAPLAEAAEPVLPGAFPVLAAALRAAPARLLCVRPAAGAGSGLDGFFRTVAREYPDVLARVVGVDPAAPAEETAALLLGELSGTDREPVVEHTAGARHGFALAAAPLGPPPGAALDGAALGLDRESVVLLAGGARGITAHVACALAAATGCRVELLGRTPQAAGPEAPDTAGAADRAALRAALAARGGRSPAEIEREAGLLLAQREVAATLAQLDSLGSEARYRCADLRDAESVRQAVKAAHTRYGRLDGVLCAAGVIEDRLIAQKTPESFNRVFSTKVDGARTLLDAVAELPQGPRFAVLFGSVSAVLGNRGQCDYAAANDALEGVAAAWAARTGRRALTVHWGPWAPAGAHPGMVTPELSRDYARRGVGLIDPDAGARALLDELARGGSDSSVVYTSADGWGA